MVQRVVAVALGLALVLIGSASAGEQQTDRRYALLRLASAQPLKVKGLGFVSGERVRVTVIANGAKRIRKVTAGVRGSFVTTVPGIAYDRCSGLLATAVGSRGSRATLKMPEPLCPPRL